MNERIESKITVLRATREDLPLVTGLFRRIEAQEKPGDPRAPQEWVDGLDASLARFDAFVSGSFWLLIVCVNGTPAGYASLARIPKPDSRIAALYVDELHVLQGFRRRGAALALLAEATRIAREIGAWQIRLQVDSRNMGARDLYRSAGFAVKDGVFCFKPVQPSPVSS